MTSILYLFYLSRRNKISLPTKVYCQNCTIKGLDITLYVNSIQVFEDICKPYLTATITVIDNNNILNTLDLVGGEQASFTFVADGGQSYSASMQVFSIKGEKSNYSLRAAYYQIELIGPEYFNDRKNLVQQSFKNITGTGIISSVHSQYIGSALSILTQSNGLLATNNTIIAHSSKPFKFIDDIRRQLTFGQYQSGASVYYHDNSGVKFAAFEQLMSNLSPNAQYIQKATWGASWQDIFNSQFAIIDFTTTIDVRLDSGGRANMKDISAAFNQELKVIDILSHKRIFNNSAQNITSGGSIASLINLGGGSSHGGRHNYYFFDSGKFPPSAVRQTDKEAAYKAKLTSGPQITIKVPIQSGLLSTVGQGFGAFLIPPVGDTDDISNNPLTGNYLAIKVMHECHFDDHQLAGVSTITGLKSDG